MKGRILVVDDEKNLTIIIQAQLERAGYEVVPFNDSRQALEALLNEDFDCAITDLNMPEINGLQLLEKMKVDRPSLPVIMITAFGTVEVAVSALKKGAFDFITKPFDQVELLNAVQKATQTSKRSELETTKISGLMGVSREMQDVFKTISKTAPTTASVLIQGESGTGKELVASEIHQNSLRSTKAFVKVNCAAIPFGLIESEFFGYEKGAFAGAMTAKPGRFELAHEGTLFLDEVADLPLEMQVKLLRVLQEQEIERVGGIHKIKVDVRIIAATNQNLEEQVKTGRFREDLFYRLNVVAITLPPLRNRREDIEPLVNFFLSHYNQKFSKKIQGMDPKVLGALREFSWPGNISQLESVIERMVLMTELSSLQVEDLPEEIRTKVSDLTSPEGNAFKDIVRRERQSLEKNLIEKALDECGGNVTRAAERLGLSRKGLQLKMKELGFKRFGE